MENKLSCELAINIKNINQALNVETNFDIVYRVLTIADTEGCFYVVDGMNKDDVMQKLMQFFYGIKPEEMPKNAHEMSVKLLPYGEVDFVKDIDTLVTNVLSGVPVLVVDGYDKAISIDFRTYPSRGIEEPEKEKVLRGARDGFCETLVMNTALVRRRIRNPNLTMEYVTAGKSSKTDIVFCYMKDRVDHQFLARLQDKVKSINVDALTMGSESLAECIHRGSWWNPFPKFKYSERPDATASAVLEGSIVIFVDTSPSAMILPTSLFEITEEADDYYFPPITGTYLRITRAVINLIALFLTPLWLLLMNNQGLIPKPLEFIVVKDAINIPLLAQLLILEFAIDGLKMASVNTPSMLSTPLSVVAGIVLGDFTVSSGWFNSETMLYMAFVVIANYSQSSYELGYALKFLRIILLVLTGVFGIWGFVAGLLITFITICFNKTISGQSYLYPLIPFNARELGRRFLRLSLPAVTRENRKTH
ncbi:MAG: spore germination protein [bacterium]|nr:spore germination protein [bacterium]